MTATVRIAILATPLCVSVTSASAATVVALSPSRAHVGAAVAAANTGDIVSVPAGSATWTSMLTITKGITLMGAGAGSTIITSGVPPGYFSFIIDYDPDTASINGDVPFRITGFEFNGNWNSGCVIVHNETQDSSKPITKVRIDHNDFHDCGNLSYPGRAILTNGMSWGVIDHNTFEDNQKTFDEELSDETGWGATFAPGSANFMYFEDNIVTNADSRSSLFTSGGQGGRYVVRHNTFDATLATGTGQYFDIHGTLGANRGTVGAEIYNNTLTTRTGAFQFADVRGGTDLIFNNRIIKPASDIEIQLREEDTGTYPLLDQIKNTYLWNNTYGSTTGLEGTITPFVSQGATYVQLDRDFFLPPSGLEANRPGSCTAGARYATTDTGKLFRCQSANNWTVQYQPYTYPHPLTSVGASPSAPKNLRIVP